MYLSSQFKKKTTKYVFEQNFILVKVYVITIKKYLQSFAQYTHYMTLSQVFVFIILFEYNHKSLVKETVI